MPTYQYACTECADQTEVVQRFTDDPLTVCGACGGRLRKVYSPVGIVFKGSGFYRTDSRAGAVSGGSANGKSGGEGSDSSGSKSESGAKAESGSKSDSKSGSDSSSSASNGSSGGSSGGSGKSESKSGSGSAKSGTGSKVA